MLFTFLGTQFDSQQGSDAGSAAPPLTGFVLSQTTSPCNLS